MKMLLENKRNQTIVILIGIMALAFFVRAYHFREFLYFKMDQSRDTLLISNAVKNGPGYLPLLGPRAGATDLTNGYLRLGPMFYYFQYLSGVIFHSTDPAVFAYADLFFSIAVLPLLFILLRMYFSRNISLLLVFLYSLSFLVIEYSRFAWNPNSLPFFTVLAFLGLLKFLNEPEAKKSWKWVAIWALGLSIGSQLHFYGFFSLVGISAIMIFFHYHLWKKESILASLKGEIIKKIAVYAGIFVLVFGFFYIPVVISDVMKGGQNAHNFIEALSSKPKKKPLMDKIQRNFRYHVENYCLITTSSCLKKQLNGYEIPAAITSLILLSGLIIAIRNFRREKEPQRKSFLLLVILWSVVFFILTIPVSYQIRPRFFIFVFAIPYIFLGLIFKYLEEKFPARAKFFIAGITVIVFSMSAYGTLAWFKEQSDSQVKNFPVERTLILKNRDGVTLGQLQRAVDFMYTRSQDSQKIYFYVKPEHTMPVKYLLMQKQDKKLAFSPLSDYSDPNAHYFAIVPADKDEQPFQDKFGHDYTVLAKKPVGQISVFEVKFTKDPVIKESFFNKEATPTDRLFWRDVFGQKEDPSQSINTNEEENMATQADQADDNSDGEGMNIIDGRE